MRLLLVEDDVMVASGIKLGLCDAGYAVDWVGSAERALEAVEGEAFDAAIIDIGLPRMDGLELTAALRAAGRTLPVLVLTARDALHDRVQGLDMGADDYMVKPFELPELLARLRALLRRSQAATSAVLSFGPIEMDTAHRHVRVSGQPLELGPREWTVLEYLLLQAPKPAAKDKMLQALTGWDKEITPNAIEVYISRLRGKLDGSGVVLRAIRGFGYRLELAEPVVEPPEYAEAAAQAEAETGATCAPGPGPAAGPQVPGTAPDTLVDFSVELAAPTATQLLAAQAAQAAQAAHSTPTPTLPAAASVKPPLTAPPRQHEGP